MDSTCKGCRRFLDRLGGVVAPFSEPAQYNLRSGMVLGVWWVVLLLIVYCFSGRETKFIYIDF